MPSKKPSTRATAELVEQADVSLLEVVDHVLNQGVVLTGELVLGVAEVDLVYLRVSALLCAADRVLPAGLAATSIASGRRAARREIPARRGHGAHRPGGRRR